MIDLNIVPGCVLRNLVFSSETKLISSSISCKTEKQSALISSNDPFLFEILRTVLK